jgi:hypothetical protein
VPGVAQAAIQEGRYVGRLIAQELTGPELARPFRYFDKGHMAVVGKNYAVLERGWLRSDGFLTWIVWGFIHILSLPELQNRLRVQHQWLWSYFTGQRISRLIAEPPPGDHQISLSGSLNFSAHPPPTVNCRSWSPADAPSEAAVKLYFGIRILPNLSGAC